MKIRTFAPSDTDGLISLWKKCELVVQWNDPEKDILRKLTTGADLFLVGEIDGQIMATVMGGYDGHRGWANYLAVNPLFQQSGYGRALMNELELRLIERGCPKINLQIRTSNKHVQEFYEAIGYSKDEVVSYGKRLISDN